MARHSRLLDHLPGGREHLRECGRPHRLSVRALLLHGSYGAKAFRRPHPARTRVSGDGLSFLDAGPSDFGRHAKPFGGIPRRNPAVGCGIHHGRVGFFPGSSLVDNLAPLDLAAGRSLLRRACEQLPRLVSHGICLLPVVCAVFVGPFDEPRSFAIRVLACRSVVLRGVGNRKYLARPSTG